MNASPSWKELWPATTVAKIRPEGMAEPSTDSIRPISFSSISVKTLLVAL
jgi:hypothetical protein